MLEQFSFSIFSYFSWMVIGAVIGVLVHYLDDQDNNFLVPTLIAAIVGSIGGGFVAHWIFGQTNLTVSDLMVITSAGLFLAILSRVLLKTSQTVPDALDYKYAYSQISRPSRKEKIKQYLAEVKYPLSKADLLRYAEKNNAGKEELTILEKLPEHIYQSSAEIESNLS